MNVFELFMYSKRPKAIKLFQLSWQVDMRTISAPNVALADEELYLA